MKKLILTLCILSLFTSLGHCGVKFNGDDDYIDFGDNVEPSTAVTMCAWVTLTSLLSVEAAIVSKDYSGVGQPYISLYLAITALEYARFSTGSGGTIKSIVGDDALSTGVPYLICGKWTSGGVMNIQVYDTSGTQIEYRDSETKTGAISYSAEPLYIGVGRPGANPFPGTVYETTIWGIELTDDEVVSIAKSHGKRIVLQIQPSNLLFYTPLDDNPDGDVSISGDTYRDMVGGLTGTGTDADGDSINIAEEILTYP